MKSIILTFILVLCTLTTLTHSNNFFDKISHGFKEKIEKPVKNAYDKVSGEIKDNVLDPLNNELNALPDEIDHASIEIQHHVINPIKDALEATISPDFVDVALHKAYDGLHKVDNFIKSDISDPLNNLVDDVSKDRGHDRDDKKMFSDLDIAVVIIVVSLCVIIAVVIAIARQTEACRADLKRALGRWCEQDAVQEVRATVPAKATTRV
eukprot:sb/3470279/